MNTSNSSTDSAVPTTAETSEPTSQTKDPSVALSEGLLKLNWLNGLADLRRAQRANHDLLAAQLQQQYGKTVLQPGEDMIAVESPITNNTHYHTTPQQPSAGWPLWLKGAALVLGLAGAGGLGTLLPALLKPSPSGPVAQKAADPQSERAYQLDFWEPQEVPKQ